MPDVRENPLAKYENYLNLNGSSLATQKRYRYCLNSLFQFLKLEPEDIAQVTVAHLRSFVANMRERGLADSSIATHVQTLKAFFGYAREQGLIQQNPADRLPNPKVGKRLPRTLSPDEVRAIFAVIERGQSKTDRRNLVVFHLCYTCGLRIGEVASLTRDRVNLADATLRVIGKGNKEREIYLKPMTVQLLAHYMSQPADETYLFPGKESGHVGRAALESKFQEYVKAAGLKKRVTPHALRHSIAVHYLMGGAPISFVQHLLGHESLVTTGIYTRLTDAMTKQVARQTLTALDPPKGEQPEAQLRERQAAYYTNVGEWEALLETIVGEPVLS